jgi:hypothetical protein
MTPTERYAAAMWQIEEDYCIQRDRARFEAIPETEKEAFRANLLNEAELVARMILEPTRIFDWHGKPTTFLRRCEQGALHPDNRHTRRLFTELTKLELPPTVGGTAKVVDDYIGADLVAAYREAREAETQAVAEEQAREAAERFARLEADFLKGIPIGGSDFADLARHLGIQINPRTLGVFRSNKLQGIRIDGRVSCPPKWKVPEGVADVFRAVKRILTSTTNSQG